ncbi:Sphingosine kinase 2 [Nymphon striatum]|nr:Sphingosine kinase 2 [Nymphon striatum]
MLTGKFELNATPPFLCDVSVDSRGIVYKNVEKKGCEFEKRFNIADIIGCHCMKERLPEDVKKAAYFCIYTYTLQKKAFSLKTFRRNRDTVTFKVDLHESFEENLAVARKWKTYITAAIRGNGALSDDTTDSTYSEEKFFVKARKLLILVNPNSGPKKAKEIFNGRVKPILSESGINYDLIITERANHARDLVKSYDLHQWDGIVIVSGDGLIYEVYNGIMERPDWREILRIPLGIVPGGSGNGLARAISYSMREPYDSSNIMYNSMAASLNLVRGRVTHMDLIKVMTAKETIYSFLSIGWGLFADIDIESEKMRSWGEARFMMRAFVRIAGCLRLYRGKLSYLPIEGYIPPLSTSPKSKARSVSRSKTINDILGNSSKANSSRHVKSNSISASSEIGCGNLQFEKVSSSEDQNHTDVAAGTQMNHADSSKEGVTVNAENLESNNENFVDVTIENNDLSEDCSEHKTFSNEFDDCNIVSKDASKNKAQNESNNTSHESEHANSVSVEDEKKTSVYIPPLDQPVPDNWITEEDEYVMVYFSSVTHVGSDICLAPDARFDDGIIWMVIIRGDVSRAQILEFCMCLEDGRHINSSSCSVIPIRAFRLEPEVCVSDGRPGYLTVDGEVIEYGPIQAGVLPSVARIMTR